MSTTIGLYFGKSGKFLGIARPASPDPSSQSYFVRNLGNSEADRGSSCWGEVLSSKQGFSLALA